MINFDDYTNENKTEHNSKWPYIPYHPYRILIVGGSGSGKTNALLNLINNQPVLIKLINKRKKVGIDHFNNPKAFMDYSNIMQGVYKNTEEYNPRKKR